MLLVPNHKSFSLTPTPLLLTLTPLCIFSILRKTTLILVLKLTHFFSNSDSHLKPNKAHKWLFSILAMSHDQVSSINHMENFWQNFQISLTPSLSY